MKMIGCIRRKEIIAVFILCVILLAGCGEKTTDSEKPKMETDTAVMETETVKPEIPGEMYDTGEFRALVPEGWKAFPIMDVFSEDNAEDTSCFNIIKEGTSDLDLFSKPYVRLDYYGPDTMMMKPSSEYYENVQEVADMQLGTHSWTGFIGEDGYGKSAILWMEEGEIQCQAIIWLEVENKKITLEDADVQAILASVEPSDGLAVSDEGEISASDEMDAGNYDWWEGDWYGWWAIKNGTGIYQKPSDLNLIWDAYAEIEVYNDNTGFMEVWDTGTSKDNILFYGYDIVFEPGVSDAGRMVSSRVVVFPNGEWNHGMEADTMDERETGWMVDPAESAVSHFENMIEVKGHYVSPENPDDSFDYYIYLRPWGMLWDDIRNGDTSGCLYKDMMPLYHDNWYVSLLNLGYERPTSTFEEGIAIIEDYLSGQNSGGGSLDPSSKEGADGKVDMAVLKAALEWCKAEASYDTPYETIAAQFGVHGKLIDDTGTHRYYRWWATKDAYVQITFTVSDDGTELWNITQYDGL